MITPITEQGKANVSVSYRGEQHTLQSGLCPARQAETGRVEFFVDRGPVNSSDFKAQAIVPIRVPECTWNVVETVETVRGQRWTGFVKVSDEYEFVFCSLTVIRNGTPLVECHEACWILKVSSHSFCQTSHICIRQSKVLGLKRKLDWKLFFRSTFCSSVGGLVSSNTNMSTKKASTPTPPQKNSFGLHQCNVTLSCICISSEWSVINFQTLAKRIKNLKKIMNFLPRGWHLCLRVYTIARSSAICK